MTRLHNALVAAAFNALGGNYFPIFALINFLYRLIFGASPALWADAVQAANLAGTYANGTSGVGATLTKSSAGALGAIDGVTPYLGMFVLLTAQSTAAQNGLYVVTNCGSTTVAWVLTRWSGWDQSAEMKNGSAFYVRQGSSYGGTAWAFTGASSPTVGTTSLTIAQDSLMHTAQPAGTGIPICHPILLSQAASGAYVGRFKPGYPGKWARLEADVVSPVTTTSKACVLQAQISGVDVSGLTLSLNSTQLATLGTRVVASAPTGSNVFDATQELEINVNSAAAQFSEGQILAHVYLDKQ